MHKAPEPRVTALEVPGFYLFCRPVLFGEQGPSAFVTNTGCFNCFLCLSQLSAPNGVRVGRGGALGGFGCPLLLEHSQAGEGLHPTWHLGNLWLSLMCAHSTPEAIPPIQNHPFWKRTDKRRQCPQCCP